MSENTFSRMTTQQLPLAVLYLVPLLDSTYFWSCWHRWRHRRCTWWQSRCISWRAWQHRPSVRGWHDSTAPTGTVGPIPWRRRPTRVSGPTLPKVNVKAFSLFKNKVHTSCLSISLPAQVQWGQRRSLTQALLSFPQPTCVAALPSGTWWLGRATAVSLWKGKLEGHSQIVRCLRAGVRCLGAGVFSCSAGHLSSCQSSNLVSGSNSLQE